MTYAALVVAAVFLVSSCSSTTASTTTPPGGTFVQWPAAIQELVPRGVPVPDFVVEEAVPFGGWDFVSGSALSITGYDQGHSIGPSGVFATIERPADDTVMYCIRSFAYGGRIGAARCAADEAQIASLLSFDFDLSGTCEPLIAQVLTVWGLPSSAFAFVVVLDDGDRLLVSPHDGVAVADWEGERSIASIRFVGATPEQVTRLASLSTDQARMSCTGAESGGVPLP